MEFMVRVPILIPCPVLRVLSCCTSSRSCLLLFPPSFIGASAFIPLLPVYYMASAVAEVVLEKKEEPPPAAAAPSNMLPSPLDNETPSVSSLFPTAMTGKRASSYMMDPGTKPRKKRAFKKAPGAPKRAKSAYILFSQKTRSEIKEKLGPNAKVTEIMRGIAEAWKELDTENKAKWDAESEKDKERYRQELENYTGPLKVANRRQKKPADAPKRAMSAFLLFSQSKRGELRKEHPLKKNVEISQLLGELWRDLPAEEKEPFQKQAKEDGAKYKEFMAKYKGEDVEGEEEGEDPDEEDDEEGGGGSRAGEGMEYEEEGETAGREEDDEEGEEEEEEEEEQPQKEEEEEEEEDEVARDDEETEDEQ